MSIFHAVLLGIVQGITEFLPISSTGHLILAQRVLNIDPTAFSKSFDIIIQLGAILAVIVLYWKKLTDTDTAKKVLFAFIPTGIVGLLLYKTVKTYLLGSVPVVLWSLGIGGIVLVAFELWHDSASREDLRKARHQSIKDISYKQAFIIGLYQSVAIIPGVSRSAATIMGGLALGISRVTIVEFSFLLAAPTMLAASGLDLVKNYSTFSTENFWTLAVGFVISFLVALPSLRFLLDYVRRHTFIPFGMYRIAIAMLFFLTI